MAYRHRTRTLFLLTILALLAGVVAAPWAAGAPPAS